jgi:hypothetical protein
VKASTQRWLLLDTGTVRAHGDESERMRIALAASDEKSAPRSNNCALQHKNRAWALNAIARKRVAVFALTPLASPKRL